MCYHLVFGHTVCINDHPQSGSGEIFQRQCRQQAEDSQRTGIWEVKCYRYTPPFFVFDEPRVHRVITDTLNCKTCCKLAADPELKELQRASDEISDERDRKRELHAKLIKNLVKDIYLRNVKTDVEHDQWHKDCDTGEKHQHDLESSIKSLTSQLEAAEKKWADKKREIEEPDEEDFIEVALAEFEQRGNQDGGTEHLFYFREATPREVRGHPYHFPKCFPPESMLRWYGERLEDPYYAVRVPLSSTLARHDTR